jgi:hypothetical protein
VSSTDDLVVQRSLKRWEVARMLVPVVWIVSLWFPIKAATPIAEALAGEDTNVTVTFSLTIVFTLAFGAGVLSLWLKNRSQANEIRRLRQRCNDLEKRLNERMGHPS